MARLSFDAAYNPVEPAGTLRPGRTPYIPPTAQPMTPESIRANTNESAMPTTIASPRVQPLAQPLTAPQPEQPGPAVAPVNPPQDFPMATSPVPAPAQPAPPQGLVGGNPVVRQETDGSFWYQDGTHVSAEGMVTNPDGSIGWTGKPGPIAEAWGEIPQHGGPYGYSDAITPGQPQNAQPQNQQPQNYDSSNPQSVFNQLFPGDTLTPQQLAAAAPELAKYGITVLYNASGVAGKIQLRDGRVIDVIQGAASGMNKKQWLEGGGGGAGAGGGLPERGSIDEILAKLLQSGGTEFGNDIQGELLKMIASGGVDRPALQNRLVGAREDMARAQRGQTADLRGQLAASGLASTPGVAQGAEGQGIERINERLGETYAGNVRDIETHALDVANSNIMDALQMATGMSRDQSNLMVQLIGQGTQRDQMFANIALTQLSENRQWNQFLASYGLSREQLQHDIEQGDTQNFLAMLDIFMRGAGTAAGGYIGPES